MLSSFLYFIYSFFYTNLYIPQNLEILFTSNVFFLFYLKMTTNFPVSSCCSRTTLTFAITEDFLLLLFFNKDTNVAPEILLEKSHSAQNAHPVMSFFFFYHSLKNLLFFAPHCRQDTLVSRKEKALVLLLALCMVFEHFLVDLCGTFVKERGRERE